MNRLAGWLLRNCAFLLFTACASAAVLRVGPGQQYPAPCAAIAKAAEGDTIEIDAAGSYRADVCQWTTNRLTIRGVNGRPRIDAAGSAQGGRAIWLIRGNDTTVENVELTGAAGPFHNGAGILQLGVNLTVRNCYFHGNQDGILAGDNPSSEILVENTEFSENGFSDGNAHNLYINHIARFTLQYSYSHDAIAGHLVKSRAAQNYILYNRLTGESGTASYELDLPNGGLSYVIGNVLQKGLSSENPSDVAYAEEGASNAHSKLYFVNNTVVNNRARKGTAIKVGFGAAPALVQNNIFSGSITFLIDQPQAQLSHNLTSGAVFTDPANYDYHLRADSFARDFGADAGTADGFPLAAAYQYVHSTCFERRKITGAVIDAGAFEFQGGGGADPSCSSSSALRLTHLKLPVSDVSGGDTLMGTLQLSAPAPAAGAAVVLASSAPAASVPGIAVVAPGRLAVDFRISTEAVDSIAEVTISATYGGETTSAVLSVGPGAPVLAEIAVAPSFVPAGGRITATVTLRHPSPSEETTVTLAAFPAEAATLPASITVPAGSASASFSIQTNEVSDKTRLTIWALYSGVSKSATLTVTPRPH